MTPRASQESGSDSVEGAKEANDVGRRRHKHRMTAMTSKYVAIQQICIHTIRRPEPISGSVTNPPKLANTPGK